MAVCGKHDVRFPEGGTCWCCDQEKNKKAEEPKAAKTKVATGGQ